MDAEHIMEYVLDLETLVDLLGEEVTELREENKALKGQMRLIKQDFTYEVA